MNWKTTLVLAVLAAAGGASWYFLAPGATEQTTSVTLAVLDKELTRDRLTRIEIQRPDGSVVLEKGAGGEWSLPGKWPVRRKEVEELLDTLTGLRSRFVPEPLGSPPDLKRYGLDREPLVVKVKTRGQERDLTFGRKPDEANRFAQATYVRVDQRSEVVRLAPGILAVLDRPQEDYQQRRLFPAARVAKESDPAEKVERLTAQTIEATWGDTGYTLTRKGDGWLLNDLKRDPKAKGAFKAGPVRDRPNPEQLDTIRAAIPDIWVERFVASEGQADLEKLGLKVPEQTIKVTRPSGDTIVLHIGKVSAQRRRMVQKPAPPLGGPPMKPLEVPVIEEFRYARLEGNDQLFEIKGDRLKDVLVAADTLRDAHLARFRPDDVRRVEINEGGRQLVFVHDKDKDRWRIEKPAAVDAERVRVTELLDKLAGLEARGADAIDAGDRKQFGLEKPATIKLTVEEAKTEKTGKDEQKETRTRHLTFALGKHDTAKNRLYVQVEGWDRISAVDDALRKLVQRPALAYRSRRVLDLSPTDVARIDVQRPADSFALEQTKHTWQLAAPVAARADGPKAEQLANELTRLEAVEFVKTDPTPEELAKEYGLKEPALMAKVTFTDAKKAPVTVALGKQRPGKQEFYARAGADPAVFAVKKETQETLARDSLSYRPLQLWQLPADEVAEVRVAKGGPEYRLRRDNGSWKLTGPFEAPVAPAEASKLAEGLADLRAEKYVAHAAKDLAKYGLEKPYLRVTVVPEVRKEADPREKQDAKGAAKKGPTTHVILVGDPTEAGAKSRYAKLGDNDAVFVLAEKTIAPADRAALDLLDRTLLTLDHDAIQRVQASGAKGPVFTLERAKGEWQLLGSPASPFRPDADQLDGTLRALASLKARRLVAYAPKPDLAAYGLDRPALALRVTVQEMGEKGKTSERIVTLGKPVAEGKGERYVRVDKSPAVAVLDAGTAEALNRTHLDFVSRLLLRLEPDQIASVRRTGAGEPLEVVRKAGAWQMLKPADRPADQQVLDGLARDLAQLRAERIAAYPVIDLSSFGLEKPAAVLTIRVIADKGKPIEHALQIGGPVKGADGTRNFRYARLDRSEAVVVLNTRLAVDLLAVPLQFRDRNLAKVASPDRVTLERDGRKVTFKRADDGWKMIEPVAAEAESAELDALVKGLAGLRADALVAEAPKDLKRFGLDNPQARWQVFADGKEAFTLLVGVPEKDSVRGGRRVYARLESGPLVFLLDPRLSEQVLAEYRNRKSWPRIDAAQVERVTYRYPKQEVVLRKVGDGWEVAGKPGEKVNAEVVRDVLDALAELRAERYLADQKADLKLYGLDRPALTVEVQTPDGKRAFNLGRPEGESERRYANVPGPASGAVFVIAEAAARRLVRPPEAFTAAKK